MAFTSFVVLATDRGWTVYQDGEPLTQRGSRSAAIEVAHDLAAKARLLGQARLLVQDAAGELQVWNLDAGAQLLARLYADRRSATTA